MHYHYGKLTELSSSQRKQTLLGVVLFSEVTNAIGSCPLLRGNKCTITMGSGLSCPLLRGSTTGGSTACTQMQASLHIYLIMPCYSSSQGVQVYSYSLTSCDIHEGNILGKLFVSDSSIHCHWHSRPNWIHNKHDTLGHHTTLNCLPQHAAANGNINQHFS